MVACPLAAIFCGLGWKRRVSLVASPALAASYTLRHTSSFTGFPIAPCSGGRMGSRGHARSPWSSWLAVVPSPTSAGASLRPTDMGTTTSSFVLRALVEAVVLARLLFCDVARQVCVDVGEMIAVHLELTFRICWKSATSIEWTLVLNLGL